ncbi:hypothetical protein HAX54_037022, partial [Datura stramonium]|nr:hypothetical protein [Datura stramonium]
HSHTGKELVPTHTPQERFGLEAMEKFYITFKEKRIIHAEAQFDAESFKTACPDIYHQIGMRDWGPFTIPVDPYFLKLVLGAREGGSRDARSNQLIVLGRANPTISFPPSESRRQGEPIPMGSHRDCTRLTTMGYFQRLNSST